MSFAAVLVFGVYANVLHGPFLFDDTPNIQSNRYIHLTKLTLEGLENAAFRSPCSNRPAANLSFALNYYFNKENVVGYHLINVLIHIITGILLYALANNTLSLLKKPAVPDRTIMWIGFLAALIWLVHPIQTQAVSYIVQRMTSMAAMFYVMSLLSYIKARTAARRKAKWFWCAGCILSGLLALASKEISATLPVVIFMYEWYFFQDLDPSWLNRQLPWLLGLVMALALVVLLYLGPHPFERLAGTYRNRPFSMAERLLTEFRVVVFYITLLVLPHPSRLNLDHDFSVSSSWMTPTATGYAIGVVFGLFALALYLAKRDRLASFCILWFLVNLAIESSVVGLELVFEHRLYLSSMLPILMAVTLAFRGLRSRRLAIFTLGIVVVVFSVWTHQRNAVWADGIKLWVDTVKKSPNKPRVHNNLGHHLAMQGRLKEAVEHYLEALRLDPDYKGAHNNIAIALAEQGRLKEAVEHYLEALRLDPDYEEAHYNLGTALVRQGKLEQGIEQFSQALQIKPYDADAWYNKGLALFKSNKFDEAIRCYQQASMLRPNWAELENNMGMALARQGKLSEAISHFDCALKSKPRYPEAHNNIGVVLAQQGRLKEARQHLLQAIKIAPDYADALNNLEALQEGHGFRNHYRKSGN